MSIAEVVDLGMEISHDSSNSVVREVLLPLKSKRNRFSQQQRESLLAEFAKSGLSVSAFAKTRSLNDSTLRLWLGKQRSVPTPSVQASKDSFSQLESGFMEVVVGSSTQPANGLVIELPGDAKVVVHAEHDLGLLSQLLRKLQEQGRSHA